MAYSVGSALAWWARTAGDRPAIVVDDVVLTYARLDALSSSAARRLVEQGVSPGDRVGLLSPNSAEWPVAALAVMKAGAVLVPVNSRLKGAEVHKVIGEAGVTKVIATAELMPTLDDAAALGSLFGTLVLTDLVHSSGSGDGFARIDRDPDEPIAILFTSGSTGRSKGVVCTNKTVLNIVFEASLTEEGLRPGTTTLLLLPFAFTPGLVWGLLMNVVLGGSLVVERELNPERAVRLIEEHRVRALFGVPLIFDALSKASCFDAADLSSLRTAVVGGAAVPVPLLRAWEGKGVALRQIYGMTEAGGVATATLVGEAAEHPDTCGSGSIFTELAVRDAGGRDLAPGEPGEILLRGPGVTPGYWNAPDATASALRDGWLHSGDLGTRDADGRLAFVDRLKDLIISGGINLSPVEIESVISEVDGVREVVVIAAPDAKFGETPAAIVSGDVDADRILLHCNEVMADYKVPRYVVVQEEPLPRLPSGKLDKAGIRTRYADVADRFTKVR
jgi:fatty-acyl-CoA synthase